MSKTPYVSLISLLIGVLALWFAMQIHEALGLTLLALAIFLALYSLITCGKWMRNLSIGALKQPINILGSIVFLMSLLFTIVLACILVMMTAVPW
jgi:hypothetical protein